MYVSMESYSTFHLPELIDGFKSGSVVQFVGMERGSEKGSVGDDLSWPQFIFCAAQSRHLAVDKWHVEV